VGEVNRAKIQIVLSAMSVQQTASSFAPITYADALAPLGQIVLKPSDVVPVGGRLEANLNGYRAVFAPLDSSHTPSIRYFAPDGALAGTMWLTTDVVFHERLMRLSAYNIGGAVLLDLAAPGIPTGILPLLTAYKVNQPTNGTPAALSLHWTAFAGGKVVLDATSVPGTPFVYVPSAGNDSVSISAEIVGAGGTLGPAVVRIASPTPTSPPPAATPVPTPAATLAASG
jgi:hypothetical protein